MQPVLDLLLAALRLFGLAADAHDRIATHNDSKPPTGIGTLDPNDPVLFGDFVFELQYAEGGGAGDGTSAGSKDDVARKWGMKNAAQADKAMEKVFAYKVGDASFNPAVQAHVAARTRQLMSVDPVEMARRYGYQG